jgi:hypothetical protein
MNFVAENLWLRITNDHINSRQAFKGRTRLHVYQQITSSQQFMAIKKEYGKTEMGFIT